MVECWRCNNGETTMRDPLAAWMGIARDTIGICRECVPDRVRVVQRYHIMGKQFPVGEIPGDVVTA